MSIYKRSSIIFIRDLVYSFGAGIGAVVIGSFFIENHLILGGLAVIAVLLMLYMTIFSDNIRFEIDGDTFRYYKKGKLRNEFDLTQITLKYEVRTRGTDSDVRFGVVDLRNGSEVSIDASALGASRFYKMFDELQSKVEKEEVLEVKK